MPERIWFVQSDSLKILGEALMPARRYVVALPRFPHFCGFRFLLRELRSQIALFANVLREALELPSALGRKCLSPAVPGGRLAA